jgi:integrase
MTGRKKQLFTIIPKMQLVDYFNVNNGSLIMREADAMPFISLPDGVPCLIANAYMLHLYERKLSRRSHGGTLRQYAANISHLIRYCYYNQIDFIHMDNNRFTHFVNGLRTESDHRYPELRIRDSNTLINIGRCCLDFMAFVGRFNGKDDFVESAIGGVKKSTTINFETSEEGYIVKEYWYHSSFDTPDPKRKRSPIAKATVEELYNAIPTLSSSKVLIRRRVSMIHLLDMTGARIGEIALLKVKDIEIAIKQKNPQLKLVTLKKRKEHIRYVPVLKQDLAVLKTYMRVYRTQIIRRNGGIKNDHGFFFISGNNGKPISSRYMSNEIGLLRKAAGITTQACAQMFRHRFITKLFVNLLKQYNYENKDEFRRALLADTNILKNQVQQYTGHTVLKSLDHYIDLAFKELTNFDKVVNSVALQMAFDSFDDCVKVLQKELEEGMAISQFIEKYEELVALRSEDIERFTEPAKKL